MFVNDYLVTVIAEHKILALFTFPHSLTFDKSLAAIIAKEPIMICYILILRNNFFKNFFLEGLFFLFSLYSELLFFLSFFILFFLSLFSPALHFLPQRVLYLSGILFNLCSSRFFKSKIILSFILIHFLTSLLVFFINLFLILRFILIEFGTEPFFIEDIVFKEEISLVQVLRIPYFLNHFFRILLKGTSQILELRSIICWFILSCFFRSYFLFDLE